MKVTWRTQAGLYFENERVRILVDPYLSDSVGSLYPDRHRRIAVDESCFDLTPDIILITHDHLDHLDPQTLEVFFARNGGMTVLAGENAFFKLGELKGADKQNCVLLARHSVWSEKGVTFYSVHAEHSDRTAVGFIIDDGERTYYVSGDTLYSFKCIDDVLDLVPDGVDYAFLPINGVGNNMNVEDAADFAYEIDAKHAIPLHYGLFDSIDPSAFDFDEAILLEPFKATELK